MQCGHFPLNTYLHRINKSETDRCQACIDKWEGPPPRETIHHYIFDCPAYSVARDELIGKIGRDNFHLPEIMFDSDRMKALTKDLEDSENDPGTQGPDFTLQPFQHLKTQTRRLAQVD